MTAVLYKVYCYRGTEKQVWFEVEDMTKEPLGAADRIHRHVGVLLRPRRHLVVAEQVDHPELGGFGLLDFFPSLLEATFDVDAEVVVPFVGHHVPFELREPLAQRGVDRGSPRCSNHEVERGEQSGTRGEHDAGPRVASEDRGDCRGSCEDLQRGRRRVDPFEERPPTLVVAHGLANTEEVAEEVLVGVHSKLVPPCARIDGWGY